MPAAAIVVAVAVEAEIAFTIGTAIAGVVGATVSTAVATAIGAGVVSGGITAVQGGSVSDALKSAVIGGVSAGVGASIGESVAGVVSKAASSAGYTSIANTLGSIARASVREGVSSALTATAYGRDPVDALIKGGLTAGLTSGVMEAVNIGTSKIDGFEKLPDAVQRATKSALAAGALGKDPEKAALNSFLSGGARYIGSQLKDLGGELKASYDAAQSKGTALENNATRQNAIVDEYKKTADSLNADYAKAQTLTKEANDAVAAFKAGGQTQELADIANAKVKTANDFIAEYDKKYTDGKTRLDSLSAELDGLKAQLPDQEKAFADSKIALEDTTKLFNDQEAKNAEILANTTRNLEIASTTVKNDLGIDLGEDQIKSFVESGDVLGSAQAYVDTTNQASQDLGFDNYKDQIAAAENDFAPEQAAEWNTYKDTSGVVAGIAPGIETAGLGGQTDIANVFEPATPAEPATPVDQMQGAQTDFASPTAPLAEGIPSGVQEQPFTYTAEQLYQDVPVDFGKPSDFAAYQPLDMAEAPTDNLSDVLGTTPAESTQVAEATPTPPATLTTGTDAMMELLSDYYKKEPFNTYPGIQVAAYSPSGTMSDVGGGDIGLRSLIDRAQPQSNVPGVTGATQDNLAPTDSTTDLSALTPGSATYSALTETDPTKTIAGKILGEGTDDVRGGIESSALYSGAEGEAAPSSTITEKYLNEPKKDIGILPDVAQQVSRGVAPPTRTTLPVSSEASRTGDALKGSKMNDEQPDWNVFDQDDLDLGQAMRNAALSAGAEVKQSSNVPDYGEGWVRNSTENSQEFQTENGKVIYYDDGRVATIGNDGRYVMYMPDGSMVDYSNINDPKARVQTFAPGAGGKPFYTYEGGKTYQGTPPSIFDRMAQGITKQFEKDPLKFLTAAGGVAAGALSRQTGIQPRGLQSLAGLQGVAGGGARRVQTGAVGTKGRGGVRYFERRAGGGEIKGGIGYLKSAQDGMADRIDATIDNKRPAKLSGGEFVVPADVVSHLGNGNSEAGAQQLYDLMGRVRKARTGTPQQGKQINPKKYLPK